MQNITFYVSAAETLGIVRDSANAKNMPAPTLVLGAPVCLKMRVFSTVENPQQYPIAELAGITSWKFVMDSDFDKNTSYKLIADEGGITVNEATETVNEIEQTFTEISIPISQMNTVEIQEFLGTSESKNTIAAELCGYDSAGDLAFILQIKNFTIRNRLTSVSGPTELPEIYLTADQVKALIASYTETDPIFSSVADTLATKTYVNEAIPDISNMINVQGVNLNVGGVNEDGTAKFTETNVRGITTKIHGSPIKFYDIIDGSELLTASSSNFKYKTDYDIERMKRADANSFTFESYAYLTLTSPITSINYSLPNGTLKNAVLQFTTGETINYTITGSNLYKINKPFNFEPNTSYIIYVDVYDIFWCKLHNFNQ